MRFEFTADEHVKVKTFLKKHEISKGLLAKIKFRGGAILVNGQPQNATYLLDIGERVAIDIPSEEGFETLEAIDRPLDILYEDDHFLVLNKPYGVASIPQSKRGSGHHRGQGTSYRHRRRRVNSYEESLC